MKVTIEGKPDFKVFGIERVFSTEQGKNFQEIPAFWQESFDNGLVERLGKASGIKLTEDYEGLLPVIGLMDYKETGENTFPYMIGALLQEGSDPEGYDLIDIGELKWGVFTSELYERENVTEAVQNLWKSIFGEWFPASEEEVAAGPQLEMYYQSKDKKEFCEVWIPLKCV